MQSIKEGDTINRYRIVRKLADGGMAEVWLAHDTHLNVDVALKTLPDFLVRKDPSFVKRFRKEAQLAAKIRDANVVCVFDVGRDKSVHFITMEHIDGLSAADLIEINGRLPLQAALVLVYGAALGLRAAWKLGIIHRDVKPSNIIVDKDGTAKISDLGVAKSLGDQSLGLTFTGATVGTPSYMAPEQNQDARVVDTRADIYSLGATLFHLLTGELPFDGESPFVIVMKHQSAPVPDLVDYGLPKTVSFMVRKMMAKDPAGRYQNISAVLSDLLRVMMDDSDLLGIYQANLERSKGGGGAIQYRPPTQLQRDQVERPENHQSEITAPEPPLAAMRDAIPAGTVSNKPSTDPMVEKPVHPDDRQLGAEPPSSIWNVHKLIETGRKGKE